MVAGEKSGTILKKIPTAYKPGLKPLSTDVCIPISKLPELITFNQQYFKYLGMEGKYVMKKTIFQKYAINWVSVFQKLQQWVM